MFFTLTFGGIRLPLLGENQQRLACTKHWQRGAHSGAPLWRAFDLNTATETVNAFAHGMQPQVSRENSLGVKTDAIVLDLQHDSHISLVQTQHPPPGLGVLDNVVQRFLRNAV